MAKPSASRELPGRKENSQLPQIRVDQPEFWKPPKGLQMTDRLSRIPLEFCVDAKNMMLSEQTIRSRFGTEIFGTLMSAASTGNLMATFPFVAPNGQGYIFRLTTAKIQVWNGATWSDVATGFTGGLTNYWSYVGWGNEVLFSNGVDKIYKYNPATGTGGFITESVPSRHINVFGGRVIASGVYDTSYLAYRQKWSVKNNCDDWDGEGSGFEDMFGAPGGGVDPVHGCYPITDDSALVIREESVWQMSTTGNVLAPFRYSRITGQLGSRCRRSIAQVPGGYAFITRDNVVVMNLSEVVTIGDEIREALIPSITDFEGVTGKYDAERREYKVANGKVVWRYSFREKGWMRDEYPSPIRDMSHVRIDGISVTIDELSGNIDGLTGNIDGLVANRKLDKELFIFYNENSQVGVIGQETNGVTSDITAPFSAGLTVFSTAAPIHVATGLLQAGSVREKTKVIEVQMEFEADKPQDLIFEYTMDGGATWMTFSTLSVAATTGPQILAVRRTVIGHNIQLRLKSNVLGLLRVLSFTPRIVQEAMVKP